ncbi:malate synthase G [Clostridium botulinum B str. Osaka05]|uniref:Malate synthase G n=1 Tax=Clostridium botulinum B str. Osaka05 TaxID=1407017 RepID=A0A060N544_CLOBO|nr:hypothetical protein [Clostridium botulinum]BAO05012.1 malate synthase G [Clostridium botulinum B str. Osaka05]
MRKFESFLMRKLENKDNVIFIDLTFAERIRENIDISLGIKIKNGGFLGTTWVTSQLDVEDDFTIGEFKNTCQKFNISYSIFSGDNETYIL